MTTMGAYGSFIDTSVQSQTTAWVARPMTFSEGTVYSGITPTNATGGDCDTNNCTKLCVNQAGVYNLQFSSQFTEGKSKDVRVAIWLWKGPAGTGFVTTPSTKDPYAVPWTGTEILLPGALKRTVAAWNFVEPAAADDCFALIWAIDQDVPTGIDMAANPEGSGTVRPGVPSLILTINQVG